MGRTVRIEQEGGFDVYIPDDMPSVYADQASQFLIGPVVSKILFHSLSAASQYLDDRTVELKEGVVSITMPTVSLLALVQNLSRVTIDISGPLTSDARDHLAALTQMIAQTRKQADDAPSE